MRSKNITKKVIKQWLNVSASPKTRDRIWHEVLFVQEQSIKTKPALDKSNIWRVIMRTSITKKATAAVVALTILLPLSYGATKLIKRFIAISQLSAIKVEFPSSGALSPDGKYFAGNTWDSDLIVIDISSGEQRKIAGSCYGPVVWSTDGDEIAAIGSGKEKDVLLAVSVKTAKARTLMEDPPVLQDWSADKKFILGMKRPGANVYSAVMVNLESKEEIVLAEESDRHPSPRFSPNGNLISYVTKESNRSILHLRGADGTSHVEYADFPGEISQPIWASDGTYIIFTGTQRGIGRQHKDLWALRVEGNRFIGAPFPVVPDVEQAEFYNWSQNGQLAYRTSFKLGGIFILPVDLRTGKATGAPRQLVRGGGNHCWSPDGKQLALGGSGELIIISADSGEKIRSISAPEYYGRGTSWSPDGKWIARCGGDKEKRTGIYLITIKTGEVKLLVPLETNIPNFDVSWSPDSKTIAYGYKSNIYVVNIEDGKPQRINATDDEEHEAAGRPVFAPDGRSVAFIMGSRILATDIDSKETKEVFQLKNKNIWGINIFDLSPDGHHIVFTPGNREVWCVATYGGEPFKIADISDLGEQAWAWMPKWSPLGDSIAIFVSNERHQYWVMENFLPTIEEADGR